MTLGRQNADFTLHRTAVARVCSLCLCTTKTSQTYFRKTGVTLILCAMIYLYPRGWSYHVLTKHSLKHHMVFLWGILNIRASCWKPLSFEMRNGVDVSFLLECCIEIRFIVLLSFNFSVLVRAEYLVLVASAITCRGQQLWILLSAVLKCSLCLTLSLAFHIKSNQEAAI